MDIKSLQHNLHRLGYDPGSIDGILGPKTRAAVREFQHDHGLLVDGVPGPKTVYALQILQNDEANTASEDVFNADDKIAIRKKAYSIKAFKGSGSDNNPDPNNAVISRGIKDNSQKIRRAEADRQESEGTGSELEEDEDKPDDSKTLDNKEIIELDEFPWRELILKKHYPWAEEAGFINLIGLRGFSRGEIVENKLDEYNDTIVVVRNDRLKTGSGYNNNPEHSVFFFEASVDPGKLREPNPKGIAHLDPGFYLYRLGLHRRREKALVQADQVTITRYFDEDVSQPDPLHETGWFGINIHRGGTTSRVGNWSAGCQVIKGDQWAKYMTLVDAAAEKGQEIFGYSLVEGIELVNSPL
ncbi:peptidoglycan-binding protein [Calditrichota bacterium]